MAGDLFDPVHVPPEVRGAVELTPERDLLALRGRAGALEHGREGVEDALVAHKDVTGLSVVETRRKRASVSAAV